jgi:hypothetical protein
MIECKKIQHVVCLEEPDADISCEQRLGYFALGFESLGLKVTTLDINQFKKVHQHENLLSAIYQIQSSHPIDLLFFNHHSDFDFHGALFSSISHFHIKTAIWFGDDNHKFYTETKNIAHFFDFPITTCTFALERYQEEGLQVPIFSFWGAEMHMVSPQVNKSKSYGVTFVGTWSRFRQFVFDRLKENGFEPEFFGPGWPSGPLTRTECIDVFLNSKVNLSLDKIDVSSDVEYVLSDFRIMVKRYISRKKLYDNIKPIQIKKRPFDLAVLSAPQLIQYSTGLETFLNINDDIEIFTNTDELILKLKKWCSGNLDLATKAKRLGLAAERSCTISAALKNVIKKIDEEMKRLT